VPLDRLQRHLVVERHPERRARRRAAEPAERDGREHEDDCAGHVNARMRAARAAAFFGLSTPTVATGTPGGICTIESSASSPSSTDFEERSGTPMTGSSVWAATTPGRAAARPAPQISTLSPRD